MLGSQRSRADSEHVYCIFSSLTGEDSVSGEVKANIAWFIERGEWFGLS